MRIVRLHTRGKTVLLKLLIQQNLPITASCGGRGRCGQCRIKIKSKPEPPDEIESLFIPQRLLTAGYRLACRYQSAGKIELMLPSTKTKKNITRKGVGLALDLGTTTLKGAVVNLKTGKVVQQASVLNPQNSLGGDVITRIGAALQGNQQLLTKILAAGMKEITGRLGVKNPLFTTIVGNPAMLSFHLGLPVTGLAKFPFRAGFKHGQFLNHPPSYIFPIIGGFVGGDTIAGILASGIIHNRGLSLYLDLGTNGEIALVSGNTITAASTAAGPAFEGVGVTIGSMAKAGAIDRVVYKNGFKIHTIGNRPPVGVCASGLIDLLAVLLDIGWLREDGRLLQSPLQPEIKITQDDVRKLQLAIGAVHTSIQTLLQKADRRASDVETALLTGEFGSELNRRSLERLGILPLGIKTITFERDLPLQGAIRALRDNAAIAEINRIEESATHIELATDPDFQKRFVAALKMAPWN